MELRHLRYFIAVAEELNFRRAAARLHIAQPPLSVQIRQLETEVGAQLFSRDEHKVRLTQAGRVFLEHARQTLAQINRGTQLTRQAANGEIGNLSIGCGTVAEFRIFPTIVPAFKERWPNVHLAFHNLRTPQQLDGVRRGELDLGFAWLPIAEQEFDVHELLDEPFTAMVPAKHRLAQAASVSIQDLSEEPLVLFSRTLDPEAFHQIEQLFLQVGAQMNVAYEMDSIVSVLNFVAMGTGCSVFPDYIRAIARPGVTYQRLQPPNLVKRLAVFKKKGRGELVESFYRFTLDNLRNCPVPEH